MPSKHEKTTLSLSDSEVTAVLGPAIPDSPRGGQGDRLAEEAFDYPSPSPAHAWSSDDSAAGPGTTAAAESQLRTETGARLPTRARNHSGRQHMATRRRSVLGAVAALVLLGGFGIALSTICDTVTSAQDPGGNAPVSTPKSPGTQTLPPNATLPAEPRGGGANAVTPPTQTVVPPVTDDRADDDQGEKERGREDADHADD
ncbi:hypothetical protein SAMN05216532_0293 [Streptomyces sp. 2231.1]|nr:hypothetical protein SAMN05216532_0293 [Streptomyces sp. 2231.1]